MLEHALLYARHGWHVMPLTGKRPNTPHGWLDATTDPAQVAAWWAGSDDNVGVATGPSGLLVVDLDSEPAVDWWLAQDPPGTFVVTTGRGQHWYYAGVGPSTAGRLHAGVDTRGRGGYVVAPPSWHPATGARYEVAAGRLGVATRAPTWLTGALEPVRPPRRRPRLWVPDWSEERNLASLCQGVRLAGPGRRNHALNVAAYDARALRGLPLRGSVPALVAVGLEVGLAWGETTRTVASGLGVAHEDVLEALTEEDAR